MINPRISILLLLLLLLVNSCKTYHPVKVYPVNHLETGHSLQGFYYALPRTVLTIDVTILKTEEIPGPFARYADSFLGLEDVIMQPSVSYSIEDVSVNSYAEADPSEFYFVEYDSEKNSENPMAISLSETGMVTGINIISDQQIRNKVPGKVSEFGSWGTEATFNHFIETNLQEQIDTIVERVRMDTVTVERKRLRRSWVEKTSEVRAREVADYILDIRNKQFDVVSGFAEITYSKEAIQYMNEQLESMEEDHLELFTGITAQSKIRYRYFYTPQKDLAGDPDTLFHFSERHGVSDVPGSTTGEVIISAERDFGSRQMSIFTMNPAVEKEVARGIYYRIPEYGIIRISRDGRPLADARLLISQFGTITSLPPNDFRIEFFPETGAIKSIEKIR
ncbi:MAG: DUF4831 family protein [Bacteroidota bacterium]